MYKKYTHIYCKTTFHDFVLHKMFAAIFILSEFLNIYVNIYEKVIIYIIKLFWSRNTKKKKKI